MTDRVKGLTLDDSINDLYARPTDVVVDSQTYAALQKTREDAHILLNSNSSQSFLVSRAPGEPKAVRVVGWDELADHEKITEAFLGEKGLSLPISVLEMREALGVIRLLRTHLDCYLQNNRLQEVIYVIQHLLIDRIEEISDEEFIRKILDGEKVELTFDITDFSKSINDALADTSETWGAKYRQNTDSALSLEQEEAQAKWMHILIHQAFIECSRNKLLETSIEAKLTNKWPSERPYPGIGVDIENQTNSIKILIYDMSYN